MCGKCGIVSAGMAASVEYNGKFYPATIIKELVPHFSYEG
jgi:hypothetical protein